MGERQRNKTPNYNLQKENVEGTLQDIVED